jgi:hypothetical protein
MSRKGRSHTKILFMTLRRYMPLNQQKQEDVFELRIKCPSIELAIAPQTIP